jgi:hypothetical protein
VYKQLELKLGLNTAQMECVNVNLDSETSCSKTSNSWYLKEFVPPVHVQYFKILEPETFKLCFKLAQLFICMLCYLKFYDTRHMIRCVIALIRMLYVSSITYGYHSLLICVTC